MKVHKESKIEQYKIKVNKKDSFNKLNNSLNNLRKKNEYKNKTYNYDISSNYLPLDKNKNNTINHPYSNKYKTKNHTNTSTDIISEMKKYNNNLIKNNKRTNINVKNGREINNIFEDLGNKINSKSNLNSQNIDENLLNIENKNNKNKKSLKKHNLYIKTNDLCNNINNNNDIIIKKNYKTIENNNINNYISEFQLTNNYYDCEYNNRNKSIAFKTYHNTIIPEGKKSNEFSNNNSDSLLYNSFDNNINSFSNKNDDNDEYQNIIEENEKDTNYLNNKNKLNKPESYLINYTGNLNSPESYYFKNNIFPQKNNENNNDKGLIYKKGKSIYSNNNINIYENNNYKSIDNHRMEKRKYKNISIKNKNIYNDIGYNAQNNKKNLINNNYDYNKKLFDIYRGKLMKEFLRHIKILIKSHLLKDFKLFIDLINERINILHKNKGMIFPKAYLNKIQNIIEDKNKKDFEQNDDKNGLNNVNVIKNNNYIYFSDKKFKSKKDFLNIKNNNNDILNLIQTKSKKKINHNIRNKSKFLISNKKNNKIFNTRLFKYIDKAQNFNEKDNNNFTFRNTSKFNTNNINIKNHKISNSLYNNQIIDLNSLNNYIYKKKVRLSKRNTFINSHNKNSKKNDTTYDKKNEIYNINMKKRIDANKTISNDFKRGIIDIDINLGKPIKDINDISPLNNIFINDYNNKKYKDSYCRNKNEKLKKKNKNKKKLSLPKKKYLEEGYNITSLIKEEIDLDKINFAYRTNSYDNKSTNIKNLINLDNSYNNNNNKYFKDILVKNIITDDNRLFIHINYIFSHKSNTTKKRYNIESLEIETNEYFSIEGMRKMFNYKRFRSKNISNNSFFSANFSRNNNIISEALYEKIYKTNNIETKKDKYLFSCVKFIIKAIKKIFLKKAFIHYMRNIENKLNKINKEVYNKERIKTYRKKISKGV